MALGSAHLPWTDCSHGSILVPVIYYIHKNGCTLTCAPGKAFYRLLFEQQATLRFLWTVGVEQWYPHRHWALQLLLMPSTAWLSPVMDVCLSWQPTAFRLPQPKLEQEDVNPWLLYKVRGICQFYPSQTPERWEILAVHSWVYLQCTVFPHSHKPSAPLPCYQGCSNKGNCI